MVAAPLFKIKSFYPTRGITLLELAVVFAVIMILSGGVMLGFRQAEHRALNNASLQLQADLRYVQRRAIMEGRQFGIVFELANQRYRIISTQPTRTVRTVYLHGGVRLDDVSAQQLLFHPRGTPSVGFRAILRHGSNTQRITATVSGGRIRVFDINQIDYEE
jgi:Tfp pilus assembly protein FimT